MSKKILKIEINIKTFEAIFEHNASAIEYENIDKNDFLHVSYEELQKEDGKTLEEKVENYLLKIQQSLNIDSVKKQIVDKTSRSVRFEITGHIIS